MASTSKEQFQALFNHASIGIVVTDSTGTIMNFNGFAEGQFGYRKQEVIGQSVEILIPDAVRDMHVRHREAFNRDPHPRKMGEGRELFALKKDGTQFPVEISLSNYTIDGEFFVIAFVIDITVRRRSEMLTRQQQRELEAVSAEVRKLNGELEQKVEMRTQMLQETLLQLEQSREELSRLLEKEKELNELKSRFVTTASHEFRTPLGTILSSAFLLEQYNETGEPARRLKHIQRIKNSVAELKTILEDFLSLGKLEEGLVLYRPETFTPEAFLQTIRELTGDLEVQQKPGQLVVIEPRLTKEVCADRQLLRHILLNLLSNAIKFSPENSEIRLSWKMEGSELRIVVRDSGIGISKEDQEHLFERFFRAANALNIQGTGLGLHIVAKYAELMHGRISFESELGGGSTFTVHLPQTTT